MIPISESQVIELREKRKAHNKEFLDLSQKINVEITNRLVRDNNLTG